LFVKYVSLCPAHSAGSKVDTVKQVDVVSKYRHELNGVDGKAWDLHEVQRISMKTLSLSTVMQHRIKSVAPDLIAKHT
jgi:hypothetical protein